MRKPGYILALLMLVCSIAGCADKDISAGTAGKPDTVNDAAGSSAPVSISSEEKTADADVREAVKAEGSVPEQQEESPDAAPEVSVSGVIYGDERFDSYIPLTEGRRVALYSNHTGIVGGEEEGSGEHILDALIDRGVEVTLIFSPEHGFRGNADAGENVDDSTDESTGIRIVSLSGSGTDHLKDESMDAFDVLIVDIQDVGARFYTYYITMYYLMDACAGRDKQVIILDRPNPNGFYVDGPILKDEYRSGVGIIPVPIVHGMTLGELALMINGEGWLPSGKDSCDLKVVTCENYDHGMKVRLNTAPSPNLRDMQAIYLYPSLCLFENTEVSVGRGTDRPFEIFGSPYLVGNPKYGYTFIPESIEGAKNPLFENMICYGMDLEPVPEDEIYGAGIDMDYLIDAYNAFTQACPDRDFFGKPDKKGRYFIDLLSGSDALRTAVTGGMSAEEIKASWTEDIRLFREERREYLLYEE